MRTLTTDQRTPEWVAARVGFLCASRASDMLATVKDGEAAKRRDLRLQIVCERLTGQSQDDNYVNAAMQRGIDKEADALGAYEVSSGNLVSTTGFIAHDELMAGCSPDGLIGEKGGLELKCPKSATHLGYLRSGKVPSAYLAQILHSLWVTGRDWWDFASFDDRFPEPLQLFCVRVQRNEDEIEAYDKVARFFLKEIEAEVSSVAEMARKAAA